LFIAKTIMNFIRIPKSIWQSLKRRYLRCFASPKELADFLYYMQFGQHINWQHPEDLNQWINWLAFNTDTTEWSRLADKYTVREYVKECGLKNILVPLYAVWETPEDINFDSLPDGFVLKANNGCGDVRIIKDKTKVNIEEIRKYFTKLFSHPFGKDGAEPHYLRIPPKIIAEELLDTTKQSLSSTSLIDYKVWCINGVPVLNFVCLNRTKEHMTIDCYDTNWQRKDWMLNYGKHYIPNSRPLPKPNHLADILKYATILSKPFPQARIDLYEVDEKVYFGEITFTSACGRMDYFTSEALKMLSKNINMINSHD